MITSRNSAFAALRHRDFRLLWLGQIVSVTGSQMQLVAINWHVYLLTKSALALGLVGLFRGLPVILCSLAGGVVAAPRQCGGSRFSMNARASASAAETIPPWSTPGEVV